MIEAGEEKIGPLAGITSYAVGHAAKAVHEVLVWILAAMVAGHVAGVIVESLLTHENLVASMITGRKELPEGPRFRHCGGHAGAQQWQAGRLCSASARFRWCCSAGCRPKAFRRPPSTLPMRANAVPATRLIIRAFCRRLMADDAG